MNDQPVADQATKPESGKALKPRPPALPAKPEDWTRIIGTKRSLNDLVEDLHMRLVSNDTYVAFIYATYDEQAVEGSLAADNIEAARMLRDLAKKLDVIEVATSKLATIAKALGVVLRRYGFSRKERRNMVGGEYVPPEHQNGE